MSDPDKPPSLEDLEGRLRQARGKRDDGTSRGQAERRLTEGKSSLGLAWQLGVEMITAVAVCTVGGWWLDRWLGTRPWIMVALFLLGVSAGTLNAYRLAMRFGREAQEPPEGDEDR